LRLARNPFDGLALDRVLNRPARGIGDTTRAHLTARARDQGRPLWDLIALDDLGPLPARSAQAVRRFGELVRGLHEQREAPLSELVDLVLNRTKYRDLFDAEDPEGRSRLENIEEFQSAVQEFCERPLVPGEAGDSGA